MYSKYVIQSAGEIVENSYSHFFQFSTFFELNFFDKQTSAEFFGCHCNVSVNKKQITVAYWHVTVITISLNIMVIISQCFT